MTRSRFALLAALLAAAGCALYNDVSIAPLNMNPLLIDHGADVQGMVRKADYLRAVEYASTVESRPRPSAAELGALGSAELTSGRYDDARKHLRAALQLQPFHSTAAQIEWSLSQAEYMSNNYDSALEWAEQATSHGIVVKQWHIDYLRALAHTRVYEFSGLPTTHVPMKTMRPDVPRVDIRINAKRSVSAVIDSGAVMSIASRQLADSLPIERLGHFKGEFYGLLGEPIEVEFGLLESVTVGDIVVQNVPVAIMPDDKMHFISSGKTAFNIDFLLGANFLKEFRTDLDFPRNTVTFQRLTPADRHPAEDQNLFIHAFRPYVRGLVNGHGWFTFVLDTGSEVTFLNNDQALNLPLHSAAPRVHGAMLQGLGGSKKHGEKVEDVELGIDRWAGTFKTVPMYSPSENESAAGILGENFLNNFRVVLDYGRMRLDLIRNGGYSTLKPSTMRAAS
ncbi:MAG TPA: retroviral-like aspartic protease family protein [Thermoanaerobaculia bacterium]|jgi:predicted aspartyl protease|nr:retroviral-like aspartic protease family protein [Thermoanaerobaculia bacterium]